MKYNYFLKYWYKFFNKQAYLDLKNTSRTESTVKIFTSKYAEQINQIQKKINSQSKLSFMHSGHIGDIINILPIVKELAKTHVCELYINIDKPLDVYHHRHQAGNVYLNKKIFEMLEPLFKSQKYIHQVNIYNNQSIDINFDLIRELPINLLFDNLRYGSLISGIQPDITQAYINVEPHKSLVNKIVILRSLRYKNQFINYKFIENYKDTLFVGTKDEYDELKKEIKNLEFYDCKDFLEMTQIIKAGRFFVGNSSLGIDLAEAVKTPRLLEACPSFPARQIHGLDAYDFYFQSHFEKFFKILYQKTK
tara:strand:- start:514 stop:1434 length:921 start_codon:yes stop_codon:yes gene_type:complete